MFMHGMLIWDDDNFIKEFAFLFQKLLYVHWHFVHKSIYLARLWPSVCFQGSPSVPSE